MLSKFFTPLFIVTLFLSILFTNCNNNTKSTPSYKDTLPKISAKEMGIPGSFSAQTTITFNSAIIKTFLDSFPNFKTFEKDIASFYKGRNYAYAWYDDKGMIENANNLYNRIQNISDEGIPDKLPYKEAFTLIMENEVDGSKPSPFAGLMLTGQYLIYAKNVWEGLSEKQSLATEWLLPRKKITSQQLLDSLINGDNVLENSPVFRQYNLLKEYLKKYNSINAKGNLTTIKADKKTYKLDDSSGTISAIRERLFLLGDIATNNQPNIYDTALQDGVKQFEHRLGFKEDGIINTALLTEMNYPIEKRIEQILVNMERSRWVPVQLTSDYLLVNIPEYKLHIFEHDSLAFSMNVVVGKDQHKTVIFNGDMKYIVFSPYWNIPAGILKKEILPALKRNPNYLANHNMEWNNGSIRQKPGPQ